MVRIKAIQAGIVESLVQRTLEMGQGRGAAAIGFVNRAGRIATATPAVRGGVSGLPTRGLVGLVADFRGRPLVEGIEQLPDNAVVLTTNPGRTGLITDLGAIDLFNLPLVNIGVKNDGFAGAGLLYPKPDWFDMATKSEVMELGILDARTMAEEREVLWANARLDLKYLRLSVELRVRDDTGAEGSVPPPRQGIRVAQHPVRWLDPQFAAELVELSARVGQGREVAAIGEVDKDGRVTRLGISVVGGDGYVPSRLLASSCTDIRGRSQREIYTQLIPENAVIVHTHPGATGVMHIGDALAGPATWGRPIIAIGHDNGGSIKGATVIESDEACMDLVDEDERLDEEFFGAESNAAETEIRNRKLGVAQEFTNLCQQIPIR